jgi:hypothetical protein
MEGRLRSCGNFESISLDAGTSFIGLTLRHKERDATRGTRGVRTLSSPIQSRRRREP